LLIETSMLPLSHATCLCVTDGGHLFNSDVINQYVGLMTFQLLLALKTSLKFAVICCTFISNCERCNCGAELVKNWALGLSFVVG